MKWNLKNVEAVSDVNVKQRIKSELSRMRKAPVTGSEKYWHRIVYGEPTDHREHPESYVIGRGQQGVLSVEPYKSEILPFWRFRDEASAVVSADAIYCLFELYLAADDFVGADMAKKFLHMGFTRARRYANHPSGKKYDLKSNVIVQANDALTSEKAHAAQVFKLYWDQARLSQRYIDLRATHRSLYGD